LLAGLCTHNVAQNEKLQADLQKTQEAMLSMEAELKDLQATRAEKEVGIIFQRAPESWMECW
jgi:hypothetical protein